MFPIFVQAILRKVRHLGPAPVEARGALALGGLPLGGHGRTAAGGIFVFMFVIFLESSRVRSSLNSEVRESTFHFREFVKFLKLLTLSQWSGTRTFCWVGLRFFVVVGTHFTSSHFPHPRFGGGCGHWSLLGPEFVDLDHVLVHGPFLGLVCGFFFVFVIGKHSFFLLVVV